jgi:squalene-hopene/tetraprenyl-beta-curcumene cyclase
MSQSIDRRSFLAGATVALGSLAAAGRPSFAIVGDPTMSYDEIVTKAANFLKSRQKADGSWSSERGPGISAIAVTALLRAKRATPAEPAITKGLDYLEGFISAKSGGLAEGPQSNYVTSIALMAFNEANVAGKYNAQIKAGQSYLKTLQWDEGENKGPDDPFYGGAGYGGRSRPDLSNTSFFIEALRATGLPADDPNLKKAMVFVSRCQNLKGEFNDQPWAGKVNDGGFIYTPAAGGVSMAVPDKDENGGLRSYASMTYAGLKSMIYAGLKPDDPRVKAAFEYIMKHFTLEENPGMGQQGLYYYYQTFAKTLSLIGMHEILDSKGMPRLWKVELVGALAKRQNDDGSWVNSADRFMEGDPNLVTSYGLLALAYSNYTK